MEKTRERETNMSTQTRSINQFVCVVLCTKLFCKQFCY